MEAKYLNQKYASIGSDAAHAAKLAREMLERGFVALPEFLNQEASEQLHALVADRSRAWDKNEELKGTIAYDIAHSDEIVALSQALYDARCTITGEEPVVINEKDQVVGLPYKDSRDEKENKVTAYHYDATYINLLLPLVLPEKPGTNNGNLVLFPNLRNEKRPKIVSKVIARLLRHIPALRPLYGFADVHYEVDTMYLFFGDRCFHGVNPIQSGERLVMTINSHW